MTDREEFEKWWGEMNDVECYGEECHKRIAQVSWEKRGKIADAKMEIAWQARGEFDDARIKELETDRDEWKELANRPITDNTQLIANMEHEIAELTAKLDKAKREDEAHERWLAQLASECSAPNQ